MVRVDASQGGKLSTRSHVDYRRKEVSTVKEFAQPMIVSNLCPRCKRSHDVIVETTDYEAWKGGKNIQDAFPYLSPSLREILKTGICGECWDKLFAEDG